MPTAAGRATQSRIVPLACLALLVIPGVARGDDDWLSILPSIQIGGHAETGGGLMPGSGFEVREQGGGVAAALSFMVPVWPHLVMGVAGELTHARAALSHASAVGRQSYNVAAVRTMARLEWWNRAQRSPDAHGAGLYALLGAGWNFNPVGTTITYLAGAPAGTPADLRIAHRPGFELGGGMELSRKPYASFFAEMAWVYDRAPYRLDVFGEPGRRGTSDLSGMTILIGVRIDPRSVGRDSP